MAKAHMIYIRLITAAAEHLNIPGNRADQAGHHQLGIDQDNWRLTSAAVWVLIPCFKDLTNLPMAVLNQCMHLRSRESG
jgi:hypothetical protein